MKTSIIPKSKEDAWILKCLHRGQTITIPSYTGTITGEVTQVSYDEEGVIMITLCKSPGTYHTTSIGSVPWK